VVGMVYDINVSWQIGDSALFGQLVSSLACLTTQTGSATILDISYRALLCLHTSSHVSNYPIRTS
jgi:hypothetical protein